MKKFARHLIASFISTFICIVILPAALLLALLLFGASMLDENAAEFDAANRDDEAPVVVYNLSRPVIEGAGAAYFRFPFGGRPALSETLSTFEICSSIRSLADSETAKALLICGKLPPETSMAQAGEIRAAVEFFAQKKRAIAYLENPTQQEYYLASAATEIILNPASDFTFKGLAATPVFFGDTLKKYGIRAQIIRSGAHKTFGDIFTKNALSPEDKEILGGVLKSIWQNMLADIARSRGADADNLAAIAAQKPIMTAAQAVKAGFADKLMARAEFAESLAKKYGARGGSFRRTPIAADTGGAPDSIAVVYMEGDIETGSSPDGIAADRYCALIRKLARDKNVKAVVLRIDSGGGSAYASEILRREISLAAKKKPVVASMGGACASGAYWLSTAASATFADSATITGSIGVISVLFSVEELANGFGITFDEVKTSPYADIFSASRQATAGEIALMQPILAEIYETFAKLVADARKMPLADVKRLADGRIFTGAQAVKLNLADKIGGIVDAVERAKKLANLQECSVVQYPQPDPLKEFFGLFETSDIFAKYPRLKELLRCASAPEFKSGIKAKMPFALKIK